MSKLDERLLTPAVLAEYLDVAPGQLAQMRYMGTGPAFIKIGSKVRYSMSEVGAWLEEQKRTQTGVAS